MEFLRPANLAEALELKAEHPEAVPVAGGTDVMVELNFGRERPAALLDLNRVAELARWSRTEDGSIVLGAAVPYTRVIDELGALLPGMAIAARTVGSPQIRNRGTVGGNLAAASPAGDTHPVLLTCDAEIELACTGGTRRVPAGEFYRGVKRNALRPDELITAVRLSVASGPQQFAKIGTRNAMVIAVCSFALALYPQQRRVAAAIGSAAPTPRHADRAARFVSAALPWDSAAALEPELLDRFAGLVAESAEPIDDVRGSAEYRTRALAVLARRTLHWAWREYGETGGRLCA